jgi:hypothetical protein
MPITIMNDCRDANAIMRQITRAATLLPGAGAVQFCPVTTTLEAAGMIVDAVDAAAGRDSIILANIAPRNGEAKRWQNGAPFGFLCFEKTQIFATIDGYVFSLLQKLTGKTLPVRRLELPEVIGVLDLNEATRARVLTTQFRSFEFLPRVAAKMIGGMVDIPSHQADVIPEIPPVIWFVDCFGNMKTTVTPGELNEARHGASVLFSAGEMKRWLPFIPHLKDVPDGTLAVTVGSSGLGDKRLLEVMLQGGRAADVFEEKVSPGTHIQIRTSPD